MCIRDSYGGSRDLLEWVAPTGPVYQAGTLSGNPLGMAAGLAQLEELERTDPFTNLEIIANQLVKRILAAAEKRNPCMRARDWFNVGCVLHP